MDEKLLGGELYFIYHTNKAKVWTRFCTQGYVSVVFKTRTVHV